MTGRTPTKTEPPALTTERSPLTTEPTALTTERSSIRTEPLALTTELPTGTRFIQSKNKEQMPCLLLILRFTLYTNKSSMGILSFQNSVRTLILSLPRFLSVKQRKRILHLNPSVLLY